MYAQNFIWVPILLRGPLERRPLTLYIGVGNIWECDCGREYGERMAGSYFPEDTCKFDDFGIMIQI
ncbi:unnamed protein product [Prunus armeniaca]